MTSDEQATRMPQWHPGESRPHAPFTMADEDLGAYAEQFIPDVAPELKRHLIPAYELNKMIAYITDGVPFEESPFADRAPYYREEWEETKRNMQEIWARGQEAVPINDPG